MIIKQKTEDFKVKEVIDLEIKESGSYSYIILEKKNYNTLDAIKKLAKTLNLKEKNFGYAGNKDKKAITQQYVSILNLKKEKLENLKIKDIKIKFPGYGNKRICLGDLKGNEFKIIVRDVKKKPKSDFIENYFDEQRFSKNNVEIGKLIIKKQFKKACELLEIKPENNDFVNAL
jgi:tRNA pseudouridine13 synthase